ncbi:MAG: hypothetical protein OWT28_02820 [Firmicutes bacterium]|nr:hypothetical protein [Bacillota bacterium]
MERERQTCALCGKDLVTLEKETPPLAEALAIEGAGSVCSDCYEELARNKAWHNLA